MMVTRIYKPPTGGLYDPYFPFWWLPYAVLIHFNNTAGILYFYVPFL